MEYNQTKSKGIIGIDQSIYPDANHANEITNFRLHENGGFINDCGWEPILPISSSASIPTGSLLEYYSPVRFLKAWHKHDGAESYFLYERNGNLQYDYGNVGSGTQNVVLGSGRSIPKNDDCGTQLISCKRFSIILNGTDAPIKFWGRERVEQFSWTLPPGRLTIMNPQPTAIGGGTDTFVEPNNATIRFAKNDSLGLGYSENGKTNSYSYRVSFISNTGSESPPSDSANVTWSIASTDGEGRYGVVLQDIPIGPEGTVERVIYRTKNMSDGLTASINTYYEAFRILENTTNIAIDVIPDSELKATPLDIQASAPISHGYKYGILWNNRIWLAGGTSNPNTIIYSELGKYEQFPAFNYFETGARSGGAITGLIDYYNSLLIFREQSIDVITVTASGYQISNLDPFVGTTATNTIQSVPGVGICFLTAEGVYALTGGLQGGSEYRAISISQQLGDEWKRLSVGSLARATAIYSKKEQEYWVHYPADGYNENVRGAVLHLQSKGWSLRNSESSSAGQMKFTHFTTDSLGQIFIGTYPTYNSSPASAKSYPGIGLQVWSRCHYAGKRYTYTTTGGGNYNFSVANETIPDSTIASLWEDMGSIDIKKTVAAILLECMSQGNNTIAMEYYLDNNYSAFALQSAPMQLAETYNTTASQNVLGAGTGRPIAKWGSSVWEKSKRILVRYDTGALKCATFSFKITTNNIIHLMSYKIAYTIDGTKGTSFRG